MATVAELEPGDVVSQGTESALFVTQTVHPIFPRLRLVIWQLGGGGWSFDALDARQEVGDVLPADVEQRQGRLRAALLGEDASDD